MKRLNMACGEITPSMATTGKLLALLLLASLAQAATLEDFITPYLYPGENYSADVSPAQFEAGGAHYVIAGIKGQDAMLLNRTLGAGNATSYSFVNDTEAIFAILRQRSMNATTPPQEGIDRILSLIDAFQASRNPREMDCKHVTGLTRDLPCTLERCDACMVVPICAQVMPYWGDDFILSIIDLRSNLGALDGSIAGARSNMSLAANESYDSYALLESAVADLGRAEVRTQAVLANHVFGCDTKMTWCYSPRRDPATLFCLPPKYNVTALAMAAGNATALKSSIVTNATLRAQARAIYDAANARNDARMLRDENETFSLFLSAIRQKAGNITAAANAILGRVSDDGLRADLGTLDELVLNISQLGLARNFTAANETAGQFHILAAKIDAQTRALNSSYAALLAANESATLALFRAQLVLEPQDYALKDELKQHLAMKEAMDEVLAGQIAPDDMDDARDDLGYITARADAISASKEGQRVQQAGVWLGAAARVVSGLIIGGISIVLPLSSAQKESYARSLPALMVTLAAALIYIACVGAFFTMAYYRRIELHRVALILWAVIFMFLFVFMGMVTITANSLIQQQASRSAFDLFSDAVHASPRAVVVVSTDASGFATPAVLRACAGSISANLTALGKNATTYEFANASCISGGNRRTVGECQAEFNDYPVFVLEPDATASTNFYVYYAKEASLKGNDSFYSPCLIARMFR